MTSGASPPFEAKTIPDGSRFAPGAVTHLVDSAVIEAARAGWIGVDLFFVLSGFLITGILSDSRDRGDYFRNFYIRRTLRIFPLYYGFLVVAFVLAPLLFSVREAQWYVGIDAQRWWFWTYTSNVLLARAGDWGVTPIFGHFWSLAVEEQFYLVWPAVVLLCPPARLRRACVAIIAGASLFRLALRLGGAPDLGAYTLMPARADSLAAGAWIALALRTGLDPSDLQKWARRILPAMAVIVFAIYVRERALWEMSFVVQTVGYTCLALGFAAGLCLCLDAKDRPTLFGKVFRTPALRSLGRYSYAMYCFDPFVVKGLERVGFSAAIFPEIGGSIVPRHLAFGTVMGSVTFLVALVSWRLYEVHFLKLKDRLAPRDPAPAPSVGVPSLAPSSPAPVGDPVAPEAFPAPLTLQADRLSG